MAALLVLSSPQGCLAQGCLAQGCLAQGCLAQGYLAQGCLAQGCFILEGGFFISFLDDFYLFKCSSMSPLKRGL